jgi:hypothetical protein
VSKPASSATQTTPSHETAEARLQAEENSEPQARDFTPGDAFAMHSALFVRLQQVTNACERSFHRTLDKLRLLQAEAATAGCKDLASIPENVPPAIENYPAPVAAAANPAEDGSFPADLDSPLSVAGNLAGPTFG